MTPQQTEPVPFQWTRADRLEYEHCPCLVAVPYYNPITKKCAGYDIYLAEKEDWKNGTWSSNEYHDDTPKSVKWIAPLIEPPKIDIDQ